MFGSNKKDPLVDAVAKVMQENQIRRDVERQFNEDLGIHSKKVLPFEKHAEYDRVLAEKTQQALSEAYSMKKEALHPNQQKLDVHEPEKDELTSKDFAMLRAKKKPKEMDEELDPDKKAIPPGKSSDPDFAAPGANPDIKPRIKFVPEPDKNVPLPPKRPANLKEMQDMVSSKVRAKKMDEEGLGIYADSMIARGKAEKEAQAERDAPKVKAAFDQLRAKKMTVNEKAPEGAKYERMVKHIKAKYAKDGLTDKEKSIAYATAHKAKNKEEKND
jgi:hypothetical protein